ncbi:MAG: GTP pyrophosphokinase [Lachnospiraceae bacterium]|nr:GTP pyrophosphokinase [Lachnospiraceae bacterium]
MVNIRLRDYDTGAEVAVMTRRVRGKVNKEKEFMQELEQAAFQSKYEIACRLVVDRIEKINKEISEEKERKYIKDIEYRVKTPESCLNKMKKKGYTLKADIAKDKLNDIAGVRAVCYFLDDVYQLADLMIGSHDFEFVKLKDYVKKPKSSGYQSLHVIIKVPVEDEFIKVEIQLRTRAMDFWADIEHHFIYKTKEVGMEIFEQEFLKCSKSIQKIDKQMLKIRKKLEAAGVRAYSI